MPYPAISLGLAHSGLGREEWKLRPEVFKVPGNPCGHARESGMGGSVAERGKSINLI